jgi:3'-5' exoribonuclease
MENKTICDFKAGERVEGFYIIKSVDCKTSSNGKKYFDFNLGDNTGEVNAKLWEYKEGDENIYSPNILVKIRATINEWQNNLQLKIDKIRIAEEEDGVDPADYVQVAPFEADFMYGVICQYIESISNESMKGIVSLIVEGYSSKILYYPAAKKNHHSIRSGLLYHVMTMLKAGEKLCEIYTRLNKDLLFAGIILHDIAKIEEMDSSDLGIVTEYTVEGQLLGHITQGIKLIENAADVIGADKESTMLLQHMILSHHYEPEFGSPVKPMFPEAELLHYLDIIDARMFDMFKALDETKEGSFSDKIWSLENRRVYKPHS